jgi:DNA-directed RNA polymerase I, II, and III subunit RPABC1
MENMIKNAYITLKEIIHQREYKINEEDESEFNIIAEHKEKEDKLIVYFFKESKFNIGQLKFYISDMNDRKLKHCIIVYADQITSSAKKGIENLEFEVELFSLKELQYNITKHRLVPNHFLVPSNEAVELRKKFGKNLPILLSTDPVSRFFNYQKNDIIRVTRNDGYILYRIVR